MRSLKSGLLAVALAGLFGTAAVAGCSADGGGSGIVEETEPTEPGASLPAPSDNQGGGTTDAAPPKKTDAGKTDSGADAGPPPPNPGDACATLNAKASKKCGKCGTAEAICIDDGTGKGKWSDYGQCEAEMGTCTPGETAACGNCGTQTCTNYCVFGACSGEPANNCPPGQVENTTAGCATPGTYRNRTCGDKCTWGGYTATCAEPVNGNKLTASGAVNGLATFNGTLSAAYLTKRPTSSCPSSTVSGTANLPFVAVEVANPTAQTLTLSIYHSGAGAPIDTLIWVYKKILAPADDNALKACDFGVADSCITGDPCGNSANGGSSYDWAGIDNVTIPPNGKILVYSSGYGSSDTGAFTLNVKTKSVQ